MTKSIFLLAAASTAVLALATACATSETGEGDPLGNDAGTPDSSPAESKDSGPVITKDAGGGQDADAAPPPPAPTYSVGVSVTGLSGDGLVLQNNAGDDLPIGADGTFNFSKNLESGAAFAVTVKTQPTDPNQMCVVTGGTGSVMAGNVTSVVVNCTTTKYTVGGTVSGLAGSGFVLLNNGGDATPINANGDFAFPAQDDGSAYAITVQASPSGPSQTCTVGSGTGNLAGGNVTGVTVTCVTNSFTVGGTVTGLGNQPIVLQNNGGDDLTISANGSFKFTTPVLSGATYAATVLTGPGNRYCTLTNGSGTVGAGDVTDVAITCAKAPVDVCALWGGDDFEDGNADGWTIGSGFTSAVNAAAAADGTNFGLEVVGGASGHYQGRRYTFAAVQPSYMSIWLQPDAASGARNYVVLGDANTTSNNGIFFLYANGGSWNAYNGVGAIPSAPVVANQWVHFEFFMNWSTKKLDIKLDGAAFATDFAFRTTASTNVTMLNLYNYNPSTVHYDQIFMGGCP